MKCSDIQFRPHHRNGNGIARVWFPNGFGVSVIKYEGGYYECAALVMQNGKPVLWDEPTGEDLKERHVNLFLWLVSKRAAI